MIAFVIDLDPRFLKYIVDKMTIGTRAEDHFQISIESIGEPEIQERISRVIPGGKGRPKIIVRKTGAGLPPLTFRFQY